MDGCRIYTDNICRLSQLLCGLGLSLSVGDLGPPSFPIFCPLLVYPGKRAFEAL